jgi:hypothetical protein
VLDYRRSKRLASLKTPKLIRPIHKLQRKWSVVNMGPAYLYNYVKFYANVALVMSRYEAILVKCYLTFSRSSKSKFSLWRINLLKERDRKTSKSYCVFAKFLNNDFFHNFFFVTLMLENWHLKNILMKN